MKEELSINSATATAHSVIQNILYVVIICWETNLAMDILKFQLSTSAKSMPNVLLIVSCFYFP